MGIVSYAQNFEDVILWRALEDATPGFYIDVGAQHPVVDSVSKAFYEHGWRGIHVEPTLEHANLLRADRPDETVVQAIVAERPGAVRFYEIPGTGLSTARQDIAEEHHNQHGFPVQSQVVTAVTLDDLLELAPGDDIHWLKIDVEGFEREVLSGWCECVRRPWVVVVEATYPTTSRETYEDWESLILAKGYSLVYRDGLNRYYLHESQSARAARFVFPPNVFDGFQLSGTATSLTAWLVNRHREAEAGLKTEHDAAVYELERLTAEDEKRKRQADEVQHIQQLLDQERQHSARLETLQEKWRAAEGEQFARQFDVLDQALGHARLQHQSEVSRLESQLQDLRDALGKAQEREQLQQEGLQKLVGQALEARDAAALEQLKQRAELERHYVEKIDSLREEWLEVGAKRAVQSDQALKEALDEQRRYYETEFERLYLQLEVVRNALEMARKSEQSTKQEVLNSAKEYTKKLDGLHDIFQGLQGELIAFYVRELTEIRESVNQVSASLFAKEELMRRDIVNVKCEILDEWRSHALEQNLLIQNIMKDLISTNSGSGCRIFQSFLLGVKKSLSNIAGIFSDNVLSRNSNPSPHDAEGEWRDDTSLEKKYTAARLSRTFDGNLKKEVKEVMNDFEYEADVAKVNEIAELMELYDDSFVRQAYWLLLGRPVDSEGMMKYLKLIRAGTDRKVVILSIVLSDEYAMRGKRVSDLQGVIDKIAKEMRWYGLGFFVKLLAPYVQNIASRQMRRIVYRLFSAGGDYARIKFNMLENMVFVYGNLQNRKFSEINSLIAEQSLMIKSMILDKRHLSNFTPDQSRDGVEEFSGQMYQVRISPESAAEREIMGLLKASINK